MNKKANPIMSVKKSTKSCDKKKTYRDHYREFFMHRDYPVSDGFLEKLGNDLLEFVRDPKLNDEYALMRIEAFFDERNIALSTVDTWKIRSPDFKEIYDHAKLVLGMRRDNGAMRKRFDPGTVHLSMHLYDPKWKESVEWRAKLKAESDAAQVPQTVIFKKFE